MHPRQSSSSSFSHLRITMSITTFTILSVVSSTVLIFFSASLSQAAPIDFSDVWFQHNNQILDFVDQLSQHSKSQCHRAMQKLVGDARNSSGGSNLYAKKMIDSIGRPTSGILEGRLTYLGRYDECIAAKSSSSSGTSEQAVPSFSGKYCIAHIHLPGNYSDSLSDISGISVALLKTVPIKLGVCLPSTCSGEDVSTLAHQFSAMFAPALSVRVVECMESGGNGNENFDILSLSIFGGTCAFISLLIIVGTLFETFSRQTHCSQSQLILNNNHNHHIAHSKMLKGGCLSSEAKKAYQSVEPNSTARQLLLAFSVRANMKKIFAVQRDVQIVDAGGKIVEYQQSRKNSSIEVFHGIKFFAMIWIIFSHSISFSSQWINFNNPLDIRKTSHNLFSQIIVNGTFSVDCFFFISGYLVSHLLLKHLAKKANKLNLALFYLKRYLRMTPTMMAVIGFGATMLRYFGSGPEWTNSTVMFDGWCRTNWWINSLYLHNFINIDNMCLSHSWYSAVDTQFYLISPFLVLLLSRRPTLGWVVCLAVLTGSVLSTWLLTILNNYPAVPYFNDLVPLEVLNSYYQNVYIKPYCRIGPYIVGLLFAHYMLQSADQRKSLKLSRSVQIAGWLFTLFTTLGVILAMLPANQGDIPSVQVAAAYSALSRILWSLGLCWITFVSLQQCGGPLSTFLSLKVWTPFSRLTYCAYLVHPIIIAIFYGSRHQTFDYSFYLIFYFALSNICITYMVSLLVALFIEIPIVSIGQILLSSP